MTETTFVKPWDDFLANHLDEWHALVTDLAAPPDLGPAWNQALLQVHAIPHDEISVFATTGNTGLTLIFPFRLRRASVMHWHSTILEPVTNIYCMRNSILSKMDAAKTQQALQSLLNRVQSWDLLSINNIAMGTELESVWSFVEDCDRYRSCRTPGNSPPYLQIHGGWQDYIAGKSSNFRYNLRRKRRKLEARGDIDIDFVTTNDNFLHIYDEICEIENRSWKAVEGSAITSRTWENDFYRLVLPRLLSAGQVQISMLRLSGDAIAYDISAFGGRTAYCLKTSFDESYAAESPGTVLRTDLLGRLFEERVTEYDFLGAGESYKLGWSSGIRGTFDAMAYNKTWRGTLSAVRAGLKRSAGKFHRHGMPSANA